ncbi:MAG: hypothetical protein CM1200mP3_17410 [Chloroflexota bacterium]|nr:MAG: hypothetical protein CM1200mP3_17410 [Chloroflexota bacterium]
MPKNLYMNLGNTKTTVYQIKQIKKVLMIYTQAPVVDLNEERGKGLI